MTRSTHVLGALVLLFGLLPGFAGCGPSGGSDLTARVLELEKRLTTTCACHPRDIEGLPVQKALRADLKSWLEEGRGENEILWLAFDRYGKELLAAGVEDLEGLVMKGLAIALFVSVAGFILLVVNLRAEVRRKEAG